MPLAFAYHRSLASNLAVLLGLAIVETLVIHIVAVAWWGWRVAVALGTLDFALVGTLLSLLRSLRRRPVLLDDASLILRTGWLREIAVPRAQVAGLRGSWDAAALKAPGVVNLALAAWPNVVVDVDPPVVGRRRPVRAVAHRLDDPAGFARALAEAR